MYYFHLQGREVAANSTENWYWAEEGASREPVGVRRSVKM
jgi:hypothetical protein